MKEFNIMKEDDFHASLLRYLPKIKAVLASIIGDAGGNIIVEQNGKFVFSRSPIDVFEGVNMETPSDQALAGILLGGMKKMEYSSKSGATYCFLTCELILRGLKYITAGINRELFLDGLDTYYMELDQTLGTHAKKIEGLENLRKLALYQLKSDQADVVRLLEATLDVNPNVFIEVKASDNTETSVKKIDGYTLEAATLQKFLPGQLPKSLQQPELFFCLDTTALRQAIKATQKNEGSKIIMVLKGTIDEDAAKALVQAENDNIYLYSLDNIKEVEKLMAYVGLAMSNVGENLETMVDSVEIKSDSLIFHQKSSLERIRYISRLQELQKDSESVGEWKAIQKQIALLSGLYTEILVGAPTDTAIQNETKLIKEAVDELLMIIHHGMVTAGGAALYHAGRNTSWEKTNGSEFYAGGKIMFEALEMLELVHIRNSTNNPEYFIELHKEKNDPEMVFRHQDKKMVKASDTMMFDSLIFVRQALKQAVGTASQILNSKMVIG